MTCLHSHRPTVIAASVILGLLYLATMLPLQFSFAESRTGASAMELSPISGDPDRPRRHFRFRTAKDPGSVPAAALYSQIRPALRAGYALSGRLPALEYQAWARYNSEPFISAAHGRHYLNVYANSRAQQYSLFEKAGKLPVGSIVAVDSFATVASGEVVLGPLLTMEKMAQGFNYVSGDWKYTYIQPDGSIFGETNGANAQRVEFCMACHLVREQYDHLYFVPERYRIKGHRDKTD